MREVPAPPAAGNGVEVHQKCVNITDKCKYYGLAKRSATFIPVWRTRAIKHKILRQLNWNKNCFEDVLHVKNSLAAALSVLSQSLFLDVARGRRSRLLPSTKFVLEHFAGGGAGTSRIANLTHW